MLTPAIFQSFNGTSWIEDAHMIPQNHTELLISESLMP
jgi:hypothetical protein